MSSSPLPAPRWSFALIMCIVLAGLAQAALGHDVTLRVSKDSSAVEGNRHSTNPSISGDGRYVAFSSESDNLIAGDNNEAHDVFVHDRQSGKTTRVSVDSNGNNGWLYLGSVHPSITPDGRFVAFASKAHLVTPDKNDAYDIFVHDRETGLTTRESEDSSGVLGNGDSIRPSISADGRYVAFSSGASNLVPGDTNERYDVFVHDRQTGQTTCVSVDSSGALGNDQCTIGTISADGRLIAFSSAASNLVPSDTNNASDVFVHDRQTGQTTRVSVDSGGAEGNNYSDGGSISADGRFVGFASDATNLVPSDTNGFGDAFVHDRQTGQTTRVSVDSSGVQGGGSSGFDLSIAASGRFVAFVSWAPDLVSGDTNSEPDVFVHDRQTGQTRRVSVNSNGIQGNDYCVYCEISADGRYVAFDSNSTNLVFSDLNLRNDVFVRGQEFTLEADPPVVTAGQVLKLTIYEGIPGHGASLWAVQVGSLPIFQLIAIDSFKSNGTYTATGVVPSGLGPLDVTLRGYCLGVSGSVEASNDATVSFQ